MTILTQQIEYIKSKIENTHPTATILLNDKENKLIPNPGIEISDSLFSRETATIIISSAKGGSGCSFISNSLAAWFSRFKNKNVVLLDFNIGKKDSRIIFNIKQEAIKDIGDIACSFDDINLNMLKKLVINTSTSLNVVLSPLNKEKIGVINPKNVHSLLNKLIKVFDIVVIDFPYHLILDRGYDFLEYCDKFIIVSQSDYISINNTEILINNIMLENMNSRFEIVINKFNIKPVIPYARIINILKFPVSSFIPYDPDIEFLYITKGPTSIFDYNLRVVKAISNFAEKVYKSIFQE